MSSGGVIEATGKKHSERERKDSSSDTDSSEDFISPVNIHRAGCQLRFRGNNNAGDVESISDTDVTLNSHTTANGDSSGGDEFNLGSNIVNYIAEVAFGKMRIRQMSSAKCSYCLCL